MLNFQFYEKVKVVFGNGAVRQLGELAKHIGCGKALIVCDPAIRAAGVVEKVTRGLESEGIGYAIFDSCEPNPPIAASEKGYEIFQAEGCDFIIGLGGGSNIDCAKGVNILRFNPAPLIQYANFQKPFDVGAGLVIVPTTAGTGSEMSDGAILSDERHIKFNFIADQAFAEYAVVDPELMAGMPPKLTAYTGLDALTHAVEGYTGTLTNDFVQFFAEKVIDTVAEYLPRAVADGGDLEARGKMAVAASVGGFLLLYGHTHAGHSIGQTVGGYFDIPHGMACAYAEPWVLEFNAPACPELTRRIGQAFGAAFTGKETPEEIGAKTRDAFIDFRDNRCGLPSIKTFPYDESLLDEVAEVCAKEFFQQFNPRKMAKADCLEILRKMYA